MPASLCVLHLSYNRLVKNALWQVLREPSREIQKTDSCNLIWILFSSAFFLLLQWLFMKQILAYTLCWSLHSQLLWSLWKPPGTFKFSQMDHPWADWSLGIGGQEPFWPGHSMSLFQMCSVCLIIGHKKVPKHSSTICFLFSSIWASGLTVNPKWVTFRSMSLSSLMSCINKITFSQSFPLESFTFFFLDREKKQEAEFCLDTVNVSQKCTPSGHNLSNLKAQHSFPHHRRGRFPTFLIRTSKSPQSYFWTYHDLQSKLLS